MINRTFKEQCKHPRPPRRPLKKSFGRKAGRVLHDPVTARYACTQARLMWPSLFATKQQARRHSHSWHKAWTSWTIYHSWRRAVFEGGFVDAEFVESP